METHEQESAAREIRRLGASGILEPEEIADLEAGTARVYEFMKDGDWHKPDAICLAAGENGVPAMEGLRRMRDLRRFGIIVERMRLEGTRIFLYRLRKKDPPPPPTIVQGNLL